MTAGFPSLEETVFWMKNLANAGVDVIELGVPFSDPMADGPVIQKAHEAALSNGASLKFVLSCVAEFRKDHQEIPVVLMGYANPLLRMGLDLFAKQAREVGVDGVLTVDLPPEEASEYCLVLSQHQLAPIFLLSPTSTEDRVQKVASLAKGFVYYVSLKGVTGADNQVKEKQQDIQGIQGRIRAVAKQIPVPLVVGFGIKTASDAKVFDEVADAVVVGSEIIRLMSESDKQTRVSSVSNLVESFVSR
jgi:tryptophan synthase alpha chain